MDTCIAPQLDLHNLLAATLQQGGYRCPVVTVGRRSPVEETVCETSERATLASSMSRLPAACLCACACACACAYACACACACAHTCVERRVWEGCRTNKISRV